MDETLRGKLEELGAKYAETLEEMADPDVLGNQDRYREVSRRHAELKPIVDGYQAYQVAQVEFEDATEMASVEDDAEMRAYFENCLLYTSPSPRDHG